MTDTTRTTSAPEAKSTTGLLTEAMSHISGLVRKEIDLARAELNENVTKAAVAVGMIAGAVVLLLTALNVLAAALVDAIASLGIDAGWAALIVGILFAVIAAIMLKTGMNNLKASSLAPTRTAKNVQRDAHAVKETVTHG